MFPPAGEWAGGLPLLTVRLAQEPDVVMAHQRARQLARLLGFDDADQVRLATAVSEVARNAMQYARGGRVEFLAGQADTRPALVVRVSDRGDGIANVGHVLSGSYRSPSGLGLGLVGTKRLMDRFAVQSSPQGTTVVFARLLPPGSPALTPEHMARVTGQLASQGPPSAYQELHSQNQELLGALELLQRREAELARLNLELEETNRGVMALYAELDERAVALRRANELKSRFLSHVSHEFRTPLNSILALTNLLLSRVDGPVTEGQETQIRYVRQASQELYDMVNDLLDLAKVEAGKVELRPGAVDVTQLLGALRGIMRPLVTSEAVSLVFEDPPAGVVLQTDEGKAAQVLRNLVSNALKFTERGEVRVSVQADQKNRLMRFAVADTGIGIAPGDQERIFQEFAQVDSALQRQVHGTGLGLPLSRKLAELLGGSLAVESVPGRGSTFIFALPWEPPTGTPSGTEGESEAEPDAPGAAPADAVLVIDDEEMARYLVRQLLRHSRHRILEAANGTEGAERARFERPRLILLDLTMPGRSGFEVLDELKADPATRNIPVVIHTSRTLRAADTERLAGRHLAVLPKGLTGREEALALIREALGEPHLFGGQ